MKLFHILPATAMAILFIGFPSFGIAQSDVLEPGESHAVLYQWDYAKFKRDTYLEGDGVWEDPLFKTFASDEQSQIERLEELIANYAIEKPEFYWGNYSVLWENEEMRPLLMSDRDWLTTQEKFFTRAAFIEEMNIRDLLLAIEETVEQLLKDTYNEMLEDACAHLSGVVARLYEDPLDYLAQLLSQENVDEILSGAVPQPDFVINSGLNDAWYNPAVPGQGFFISVFEDRKTVCLSWNTYDIVFPAQNVSAILGDAGQRWLISHGDYDGTRAELMVYSSSGGLFNSTTPVAESEPIGTIVLQFESCTAGSVSFELPSIMQAGTIPIERVASDNVAACEAHVYLDQ